jgi:hypothetical protein
LTSAELTKPVIFESSHSQVRAVSAFRMSDNPLLHRLRTDPPCPTGLALVERATFILQEVWHAGGDTKTTPRLVLEPLPADVILCHGTLAPHAQKLCCNPQRWESAGWLETRLGPGLYVFRDGNGRCPKLAAHHFVESRRISAEHATEVLIFNAQIERLLNLESAANQNFFRAVLLRFAQEMDALINAATADVIYRSYYRHSHFVALLLHAGAKDLGWQLPQAMMTEFSFSHPDSENGTWQQPGLVILDSLCIHSVTSHSFSL